MQTGDFKSRATADTPKTPVGPSGRGRRSYAAGIAQLRSRHIVIPSDAFHASTTVGLAQLAEAQVLYAFAHTWLGWIGMLTQADASSRRRIFGAEEQDVLVVDDDSAVLDGLTELLESEGYRVATARDGWSALEKLRGGLKPSVILLDLMMPAMDGWDFRQEQLRDDELKNIPVVIITAAGFSETSMKTQFGDIELVPKPLPVDALLSVVRRHVDN